MVSNKYFSRLFYDSFEQLYYTSVRRWSSTISEIEQNDVTNDVIGQKWDMVLKNILLKCSSGHVEQLYFYKYFVKIALSCSKRQWSGKIIEIEQNDVTNEAIGQKRDMVLNKYCPKVFLWSC